MGLVRGRIAGFGVAGVTVGALVIVVFVVVLGRGAAPPAGAAGPDEIVDPEPFEWTYVASPEPHYVGVLEYGEATFTMNNGETLTTRAYRQQGGEYSIPGPTLHMEPGNTYVVRFRNLLPYQVPSPDHNVLKDPDITNLHTHGLHLSGESPADDVTRLFEGGFGGDYVYAIPEDHMGGTAWYHAHHHGSTFLQVSTGGFGLIVIDDGDDQIPSNVAAMEERELIVGYLDPSSGGAGGDTLVSGTLDPGWTVNGRVGGTMTVPPDTWQHWRVLVADVDARLVDLSVGDGCEAELMARDGVWRTIAPKDLADNTVELTGASRADLAVRCTADASISIDNDVVAQVTVSGTPDAGPHPYAADGVSTWSAVRPSYLRDLSGETVVNTESVSIGARTVNNEKFDPATPTFTLTADAVQEWTLSGATNHPFHLHVYHMQTFGCDGDFEDGEYYDTIASDCVVRFDMNVATSTPFAGKTLMHCHILDHEDRGAMGWVDVIGGAAPPGYPAGVAYSEYYAIPDGVPAAPSNLSGTVTSDTTIELTWTDQEPGENVVNIERSLDGTNFSELATTAVDATSYVDTTGGGDEYWYRVNAENAAGVSAWSNTVAVDNRPYVRAYGTVVHEGTGTNTIADAVILLESSPGVPYVAVEEVTFDWYTSDIPSNPSIAHPGSDFVAGGGTATIPVGQSQVTVPIEIIGDSVTEPPLFGGEWGLFTVANVSENARKETATFFGIGLFIILDDD